MPRIYGVGGAGIIHRELQSVPTRVCSVCGREVPEDAMARRTDADGSLRFEEYCRDCTETANLMRRIEARKAHDKLVRRGWKEKYRGKRSGDERA